MKVLIVSNQIFSDNRITNPVLQRMGNSMRRDNRVKEVILMPVEYSFAGLFKIRNAVRKCDIFHIHFGGLYALAVWLFLIGVKKPKLITFHGTDIHARAIKSSNSFLSKLKIKFNQIASFFSIIAFDRVGFVSEEMYRYVPTFFHGLLTKKAFVHFLGVDYNLFQPNSKTESRAALNLSDKRYALFSTISNNNIKRQDIAEAIVRVLGNNYSLLVMCGVKPSEVPLYINACDFLLLTSDEEGSPNIIRECLAMNKPVFSVNVGDASLQLAGLHNSCIIDRRPQVAAKTIREALGEQYCDNTRETMRTRLDFDLITKGIVDIYEELLDKSK